MSMHMKRYLSKYLFLCKKLISCQNWDLNVGIQSIHPQGTSSDQNKLKPNDYVMVQASFSLFNIITEVFSYSVCPFVYDYAACHMHIGLASKICNPYYRN